MARRALVLILLLSAVPATWAQVDTAVVLGTVTDSSGGSVPAAAVTILNLATNVKAKLTTDARGYYASGPLWPGRYRVTVQAPGSNYHTIMNGLTGGALCRD